ncbi:MAG: type II toxin-antitoxin system VapC family toxin [Chloroflexi bacterium]|nr:type II toxin-antitoxin system VapC family toxin [Chloroflexota bacterium]
MQEKGTEVVDELFERRQGDEFFALSTLAILELKSALRRLVKGGQLQGIQYEALISDLADDVPSVSIWLPVDNALAEEAAAVLEKHPLRTGDALHFASILRLKSIADDTAQRLVVVASDQEIITACRAEGWSVLNPEDEQAVQALRNLR